MIENVQIYLADQRAHTETNLIRSVHTLGPTTPHEAVGPLRLLSDDTLRAGAARTMRVDEDTMVLLLPITGGLEYSSDGAPEFLEPGQIQRLQLRAGTSYTVSNPYETETINVLQGWFAVASALPDISPAPTRFNLVHKNTLLPLFDASGIRGFIGRYEGRAEGTFTATGRVFIFVLTGVFEVANRLLHQRDGLSLTAQPGDDIEFEALSNDAVLLIFGLAA